MKKYDIFVSYRRTSYETANLIATRLKSAGYSVFFDLETLRSGKFNDQLYDVIDKCKDFILVLSSNALDRCVNDDDWVRLETCRALAGKKNIIPIMLNGFDWPKPMPKGMEELSNYNAMVAGAVEYFDLSMEKLQKRYLKSKPKMLMHKFTKSVWGALVAVLALIAVLWGVFRFQSKGVCEKYATAIAQDAGWVHFIAESNLSLAQKWEYFDSEMNATTDSEQIAVLQEEMYVKIDNIERNLTELWNVDTVEMDISAYDRFLLSLNGIDAEEISISPTYANLYYKDFLNGLNKYRFAVKYPTTQNRRSAIVSMEITEHILNVYYASILCEMSAFPEYSKTTFYEVNRTLTCFPKNYSLNESRSYYENVEEAEFNLIDDLLRSVRYENPAAEAD